MLATRQTSLTCQLVKIVCHVANKPATSWQLPRLRGNYSKMHLMDFGQYTQQSVRQSVSQSVNQSINHLFISVSNTKVQVRTYKKEQDKKRNIRYYNNEHVYCLLFIHPNSMACKCGFSITTKINISKYGAMLSLYWAQLTWYFIERCCHKHALYYLTPHLSINNYYEWKKHPRQLRDTIHWTYTSF